MSKKNEVTQLKDWLNTNPTIQELKKMAKDLGLRVKRMMKKREVIKLFEQYIEELENREKSPSSSSSQIKPSYEKEIKPLERKEITLPETYGKDKLILMPVNPNWIHIYWDFSIRTQKILSDLPYGSRTALRIYDVTYIRFDGNNAHRTFELIVDVRKTKNYYFNVPMPDANYLAELGYITKDRRFVPLLRSNVCKTPANSPSPSSRERWLDIRKKRKIVTPSQGPVIKEIEHVAGSMFGINREIIHQAVSGEGMLWQLISILRSGRGI
ncbi:DUF4912 domain-containing protein [Thermosipho ferrireducens]|uniref:DUF4912 domain-containing protein n=1 Tax=Thermosipho ferrireducens TaxID=2571116 RepID=A0ABX7S5C1_9BACT|nr:DUF4912 domain-containing protein [Thermosipho ferrireducens]QTA37719.1 DUF4912 domain-containing protein [Thermosipho ferrireducens]